MAGSDDGCVSVDRVIGWSLLPELVPQCLAGSCGYHGLVARWIGLIPAILSRYFGEGKKSEGGA